jgi:hypothetical protein
MYSHCDLKRPICGLLASVLSQTAIPRQMKPAIWIASLTVGSCLQSVNTTRGAPGLDARKHSPSQSEHQVMNDR